MKRGAIYTTYTVHVHGNEATYHHVNDAAHYVNLRVSGISVELYGTETHSTCERGRSGVGLSLFMGLIGNKKNAECQL